MLTADITSAFLQKLYPPGPQGLLNKETKALENSVLHLFPGNVQSVPTYEDIHFHG